MRRSILFAILILLVGAVQAAERPEGLVTTGVVVADPGLSLGSILVIAGGSDGQVRVTTTDVTGRFQFVGLPAGEVTFVATHRFGDGWQTSPRLRVSQAEREGGIRLSLIGAPEQMCNCACPYTPASWTATTKPEDPGYDPGCSPCASCSG